MSRVISKDEVISESDDDDVVDDDSFLNNNSSTSGTNGNHGISSSRIVEKEIEKHSSTNARTATSDVSLDDIFDDDQPIKHTPIGNSSYQESPDLIDDILNEEPIQKLKSSKIVSNGKAVELHSTPKTKSKSKITVTNVEYSSFKTPQNTVNEKSSDSTTKSKTSLESSTKSKSTKESKSLKRSNDKTKESKKRSSTSMISPSKVKKLQNTPIESLASPKKKRKVLGTPKGIFEEDKSSKGSPSKKKLLRNIPSDDSDEDDILTVSRRRRTKPIASSSSSSTILNPEKKKREEKKMKQKSLLDDIEMKRKKRKRKILLDKDDEDTDNEEEELEVSSNNLQLLKKPVGVVAQKERKKLKMPFSSDCMVRTNASELNIRWYQASSWDSGKSMMKNLREFQGSKEFEAVVKVCHHIFHYGIGDEDENFGRTKKRSRARINFFSVKKLWTKYVEDVTHRTFLKKPQDLANELLRMKFDTSDCLKYARIPSPCSTSTFYVLLEALEKWLAIIKEKNEKEKDLMELSIKLKNTYDTFFEESKDYMFAVYNDRLFHKEDLQAMRNTITREDEEIIQMNILYESFSEAIEYSEKNLMYFLPTLTICESYVDEFHKCIYLGTCGRKDDKYKNYSVVVGYFSDKPMPLDSDRVNFSFKRYEKIHENVFAIYWDTNEITFEESVESSEGSADNEDSNEFKKQLRLEFVKLLDKLRNNPYEYTYPEGIFYVLQNTWEHPYWNIFRKTPKAMKKFSKLEDNLIRSIIGIDKNILVCEEFIYILSVILGRNPQFVESHPLLAQRIIERRSFYTIFEQEFVQQSIKLENKRIDVPLTSFDMFWLNRYKSQESLLDGTYISDVVQSWKKLDQSKKDAFTIQKDKMNGFVTREAKHENMEELIQSISEQLQKYEISYKKKIEDASTKLSQIPKRDRKKLQQYVSDISKSKSKDIKAFLTSKMNHFQEELNKEYRSFVKGLVMATVNEYDEPVTVNYLEKLKTNIGDIQYLYKFDDITQGKGETPIEAYNNVDDEMFADYVYVEDFVFADGLNDIQDQIKNQSFRYGCTCVGRCNMKSCSCKEESSFKGDYYTHDGLLTDQFLKKISKSETHVIVECNKSCVCAPDKCLNRVVQKGTQAKLEVFKTPRAGWAVRTLGDLKKGQFVEAYLGEVIRDKTADDRAEDIQNANKNYLFDMCSKAENEFCIDAKDYGNVARFFNHSHDPNLKAVQVSGILSSDSRFAHIAFFCKRKIRAGEELTFDYGWGDEHAKAKCYCGGANCPKWF